MSLIVTSWIALALAALSPGPNLIAVASRALGSGRRAALYVTLGLASGALLWSLLMAIGLGVLFENHPVLLRWLGVAGGTYLFWLGVKGWRAALTGKGGQIAPVKSQTGWGDFTHGLAVTATNPKVGLLWASLSTLVGSELTSITQTLIFCFGSALVVFMIYGAYGILFSMRRARGVYARFRQLTEAAFGSLFGAIGVGMISRSI